MGRNKIYILSLIIGISAIVFLNVNTFEERGSDEEMLNSKPLSSSKTQPTFRDALFRSIEAEITAAPSQALEKQIKSLAEKTLNKYMDIVAITGHSEIQSLSYEDEWCDAQVDLRKEEYEYAMMQQREFKGRRDTFTYSTPNDEHNIFRGIDVPSDVLDGSGTSYIYSEMNAEELMQLAKKDDVSALAEILRGDSSRETRRWASERLIILGDVGRGLVSVVGSFLALASVYDDIEFKQKNFLNALEMVEYGLLRKSTSAFRAFLLTITDESGRPRKGFEFISEIDPNEIEKIKTRAAQRYDIINQLRLNENRSLLSDIDEGRVLEDMYNEELYFLYASYKNQVNTSLIPARWKESYLLKNSCVERKLASDHFFDTYLPKVQEEINLLLANAKNNLNH